MKEVKPSLPLSVLEEEQLADGGGIQIIEGDKRLIIFVDMIEGLALTRVERIDNVPRQEGSTTRVYKKALKIFQALATTFQTPINYNFRSDNPSMKSWALDLQKGQAIFEWDKLEMDGDFLQATKIIKPQKFSSLNI